jgi:alkanesulfonate monooxygenase SsuD/methylene tetrahydromethanopterin reductase-like flavin-dependent oxidoreductase (luciferase family)
MDRFEEACEIVRSLLHERRTTFHGTYFHLDDAPCDPKPVHGHLPLLVGGGGEKRTLRIAARFADEWNTWADPKTFARKKAVLAKHCVEVGRDPAELSCSTQALVFVSERRSELGLRQDQDWGRPRVFGEPAEVTDQIAAYEGVGVDEFIVPVAMMGSCQETLEMLDLFWTEVAVYFR